MSDDDMRPGPQDGTPQRDDAPALTEPELIAHMQCLEVEVLHRWIDEGLVAPRTGEAGANLYDAEDEARIALACDLHYRMGCSHESLPVILSLIDQLHATRHSLRAITSAVSEQPDHIRITITERTRVVLGRG